MIKPFVAQQQLYGRDYLIEGGPMEAGIFGMADFRISPRASLIITHLFFRL